MKQRVWFEILSKKMRVDIDVPENSTVYHELCQRIKINKIEETEDGKLENLKRMMGIK